jgi:hypothetical protein
MVTQHLGYWSLSTLGAWTLDTTAATQLAPDRLLHLDLATGALEPEFPSSIRSDLMPTAIHSS